MKKTAKPAAQEIPLDTAVSISNLMTRHSSLLAFIAAQSADQEKNEPYMLQSPNGSIAALHGDDARSLRSASLQALKSRLTNVERELRDLGVVLPKKAEG